MEEAAKTAKQSAESVSKGGEKLGKTAAFRALSQVGQALRPGVPLPPLVCSEPRSQSSQLGAPPWKGEPPPKAPGLCSTRGRAALGERDPLSS